MDYGSILFAGLILCPVWVVGRGPGSWGSGSGPGSTQVCMVRGRHHLGRVCSGDAPQQLAAEAVAFDVEAQVGLARVLVGAVAREAGLREDRSDVAAVGRRRLRRRPRCQQQRKRGSAGAGCCGVGTHGCSVAQAPSLGTS